MALHGVAAFQDLTHRRLPLWGLIALSATLVSLGGFAVRGFDENGLRFGNQLAWRFACLMYFAAIIAGPVMRLVPWQRLRQAADAERQLIWGFCTSFGVYLASLIVPNTLTPQSLDHEGMTFGMALFAIFGAALTMVIAYVASPQPGLGEQSRRAILGAGLSYYWLAYVLIGLSHLSGPHRPDAFYGFSVMLMLVALLVRFADNFSAKKTHREEPRQR
ncbi:MAG TPA: hypothetical protein VN685_03015 [Rhizomicrobium sp.]|nr:hypothetical protein [Rhizomicrobium sp.]